MIIGKYFTKQTESNTDYRFSLMYRSANYKINFMFPKLKYTLSIGAIFQAFSGSSTSCLAVFNHDDLQGSAKNLPSSCTARMTPSMVGDIILLRD